MANEHNQESSGIETLTLDKLAERFDGDKELTSQLIQVFLEENPILVAEGREALANGDAIVFGRTGHTIKGSVGYFSLPEMTAAALRCEQIGKSGDMSQAAEAFADLVRLLDELTTQLSKILNGL